jgi:hypothetical protein
VEKERNCGCKHDIVVCCYIPSELTQWVGGSVLPSQVEQKDGWECKII